MISQSSKQHLFPLIIVDLWIFCRVADLLKDGRLLGGESTNSMMVSHDEPPRGQGHHRVQAEIDHVVGEQRLSDLKIFRVIFSF